MPEAKRILIVGTGSIGERHLRCFQATGRAELSICERNGPLRERIARPVWCCNGLRRSAGGFAAPHDAAVVATPAHLHLPMSARLAEAGMHLLIEKPLATRLDGLDRLQSILAGHELKVAVAYVLRHHPALRASARPSAGSVSGGRSTDRRLRPAFPHLPARLPGNLLRGPGHPAARRDALTHLLNAGGWLVGRTDRLVADAAHQVLEGVNVEDTVHVVARHGDVLASYSLNQHQAPNETTITVVCERGPCRAELHRHRWAWITRPDGPWEEECFAGLQRDDLFIAQARAFLDLMEGKAEPACTLQEAADTLRTSLAILASIEEGTWVKVE